jgi:uncharacterized protein with GYD domain
MPHYLVQLAYTPEAWAAQLKNPQNRVDAVRPALEKADARIESTWFAFGDYDLVLILEAPDNAAAAAVALAVTAGGAVRAYKTTPLMAIEEGLAAMRRGAEVAALYRPPTG